ncbi:MAG: hypothetical protein MJ215_06720, partial [Spirochaetia bacterium]|nr:hypothetical protein [Spirochaetia bacterium]
MVMLFIGCIFLVGPIREAKNIYLFIYYGIFAAFFVSVFIIAGCILRKVEEFFDEKNDNMKALGSDNKEFKGIAQQVWNAYGATFKNKINDMNKTRANADLYFNTDSVISELFPNFSVMKWFGLVPETFVGFGILGTFLGFSVGMGNIDFTDSSRMIENVQHLVSSGFATAFNTSIVGIFCSMIYKFFIYNPLVYELDSHFRKLSDELDKEYFVNDSEILVAQVAEQTRAINDMGTTITELFTGELKNIINNFTEVLEEQIGKQTSVLDSFNNNVSKQLAQDIKDVLDEALKGIGEILRSAFVENIHNEVESMKAALTDV